MQPLQLYIDYVVKHHGLPEDLVSDRDRRFLSRFWRSIFNSLGTELSPSTAYHPQSDGQTERTNRTLKTCLRAFADARQTNWDQLLAPLEFAYNNSCHGSTHESPFQLTYGYSPALQLIVGLHSPLPAAHGFLANLQQGLATAKLSFAKAQQKMKTQADKHMRPVVFKEGDLVLLSSRNLRLPGPHRLSQPFIGPFKVSQVLSSLTYKLHLPPHLRMHDVFHVELLKAYNSPLPGQPSSTGAQPILADGEPEWEVEALLDCRGTTTARRQFLVSPVQQLLYSG